MVKINKKMEDLEKENQLLREIIDRIHEPVSATNKDGVIILFNSDLERCEAPKREDVIGRYEWEAYPHPRENNFYHQVTKKVIETGQPLIQKNVKYQLEDGRLIELLLDSYPFFYKGELAAVYNIGPNIKQQSEFMSMVQELRWKRNRENNAELYRNGAHYTLQDIIFNAEKMRTTVNLARKIACRTSPVLIYGETGTGKELFAQGIHNASIYAGGPFIAINCAAIPESLLESLIFGTQKGAFTGATETPGLFEQAEAGTLFLDEINSMPISLQAKLLRVLQDKVVRRIGSKQQKPVNCRIISAANIDPFKAVKEQKIREDLFYRLATVTLYVPPLRERKKDISALAHYFMKKYNLLFGLHVDSFSFELNQVFEDYLWPGNVRELENVIESAMNFIEVEENALDLQHIPSYIREKILNTKIEQPFTCQKGKLQDILTEVEKQVIESYLDENRWNVTKTAEELGILRQTLHYRIRKFGINKNK
ncbi:MAG: sigma 54-interacting transcriptional regulator [Dehalobacterium sp.]